MSKADLHVHSQYSNLPSEWVLRSLGMQECYVDIDHIYAKAKSRGMDFVTITDHNVIRGAQLLAQKHPEDVFVGCEVTAVFPENKCKVHILVYDITQRQYDHILRIRWNIYTLREYIRSEQIAYSVAHATCNVNGSLTADEVEKLILLFDVFESINGARSHHFNRTWVEILNYLNPDDIERLYKKHHIEPISKTPWIKGFTGGTDDHTGMFVGRTFTRDDGFTKEDFIHNVFKKTTAASGLSSDFKTRVFGFFKIQNDWKKAIHEDKENTKRRLISDVIFDSRKNRLTFQEKLFLATARMSKNKKKRLFVDYIENLHQDLKSVDSNDIDKRINVIFQNTVDAFDQYVMHIVDKYSHNFDMRKNFDFTKMIGDIGVLINKSLPIYVTYKFINLNNQLNRELKSRFQKKEIPNKKKRILWFTDTLNDLNGVSLIVKEFATQAKNYGQDIKVVCCLENTDFLKVGVEGINLKPLGRYSSDLYQSYTMRIPSFLRSLEIIQNYQPDEIIISTPGPVGIIGLLTAKLLGVKSSAIYHTDFTRQMERIVGHGVVPSLFERYLKWFYASADEMKVPTQFYVDWLIERGYTCQEISVFKRGMNIDQFKYTTDAKVLMSQDELFRDGFNLLYTGRISKDKNLKFLSIVYKKLLVQFPHLNLILVGDGPNKDYIEKYFEGCNRVVFVDKVPRNELPFFYSLADLFVFPSTTDTFGMVVLEAQACSLPVCVMDSCGSKDLVVHEETGFVLPENIQDWVKTIVNVVEMKQNHKARYMQMKSEARRMVVSNYHWRNAFNHLLKIVPDGDKKQECDFYFSI